MKKSVDLNLVPEIIKSIVQRASPFNKFTNQNEKMMSRAQIENIKNYCENALLELTFKK